MGAGMKISRPPELSDGGYWSVLPVVQGENPGDKTIPEILTQSHGIWYSGNFAVVRTLYPLVSVPVQAQSAAVLLSAAGIVTRPFCRFRRHQ